MSKWIAEFELEDGDTMPEHMDLNYMGAMIDFHCRPLEQEQKPNTDILDKIRAELHTTAEMHEDGDYYIRDEWIDEYFDKYKVESEGEE